MNPLADFYTVETESGIVQLKARGIFRKDGLSPCAGDRCTVEGGVISSIDERKKQHYPSAAGKSGRDGVCYLHLRAVAKPDAGG
ncbi:MAG: hypothetical protein L6V87_02920 [Ruminococcus sp.]|nr:MAG: hypothetical protein L6V87_02920 [Ruminococcus sp.]